MNGGKLWTVSYDLLYVYVSCKVLMINQIIKNALQHLWMVEIFSYQKLQFFSIDWSQWFNSIIETEISCWSYGIADLIFNRAFIQR